MKYDIVTIGDALEDVFVEPELSVKHDHKFASGQGICFEYGEKIPLNAVNYEIGGSACNAAVGFSRLGYKASIFTMLGEDTPKQRVVERLENENVDRNNLVISRKASTGFSVVFSINGDRTIFVYHGKKDYSEMKLKKGLKSRWYFVGPLGEETDDIENRLIKEVSENSSKIAWNPGSVQIAKGANHYRHLLKCTSVLFLNREEAIKFINMPMRPQIEDVMKKLYLLGAKIIVVTNGKEGAKVYDGMNFYDQTADQRIHRVDATGAGDSFAVGFLGKLMEINFKGNIDDTDIREALKWGIKNSNSVIQQIGAQKGLLTKSEIE